jgi:DNA repair protein RadD
MLELRPYQLDALGALWGYWRNGGGNPLVDLASGAGKSLLIADLARRFVERGRRVLVLSHVREIVEQDARAIRAQWPDAPLGINSAGLGERDWTSPIVLATVQSIYREATRLGPRDLAIVDEAHLVPRDGEGMRVAGLSATPYRLDSGRLDEGDGRLFDKVVFTYGIAHGVRDGWLAPLVAKGTAAKIDTAGVARRGGEFVAGELERAADQADLIDDAVDEILTRATGRRSWLAFCCSIAHARHVCDAFLRRGVACATVNALTPGYERREIFDKFRAGELACLTGCNIFTTGFDIPQVDLIALLRPTLSTGLYVQMLGRGTRKAEGKADCLVCDFAGNVRRHGPVDDVVVKVAAGGSGNSSGDDGAVRAKECPQCASLIRPGAPSCPDCGHVFPAREPKHTRGPMTAHRSWAAPPASAGSGSGPLYAVTIASPAACRRCGSSTPALITRPIANGCRSSTRAARAGTRPADGASSADTTRYRQPSMRR